MSESTIGREPQQKRNYILRGLLLGGLIGFVMMSAFLLSRFLGFYEHNNNILLEILSVLAGWFAFFAGGGGMPMIPGMGFVFLAMTLSMIVYGFAGLVGGFLANVLSPKIVVVLAILLIIPLVRQGILNNNYRKQSDAAMLIWDQCAEKVGLKNPDSTYLDPREADIAKQKQPDKIIYSYQEYDALLDKENECAREAGLPVPSRDVAPVSVK